MTSLEQALAQPSPVKARGWAKNTVVVIALLYAALITLPRLPGPGALGLDAGWVVGLHLAWEQGLVHGSEFVWSYGPLGHLLFPDARFADVLQSMLFAFVVHAAWILFVGRLAWIQRAWSDSLWCVVVFTTVVVLYPAFTQPDVVLITLAVVALADEGWWRDLELALLAAMAGALSMVKANMGLMGAGILPATLGVIAWRGRPLSRRLQGSLIFSGALYVISVPVLYAVATGSIEAFPAYVRYSLEAARGYSEAMSLVGSLPPVVVAFAIAIGIFVVLPVVAVDRKSVVTGLIPCLLAVFLFFKRAMVRQDGGHLLGLEANAALAMMFVYVCARNTMDRRVIAVMQVICLTLAIVSFLDLIPFYRPILAGRLRLAHVEEVFDGLSNWSGHLSAMRVRTHEIYERAKLPISFHNEVGKGRVEAVPTGIAEVFANEWTWRPRPVPQTYAAYTPDLDRLNAGHIEGDQAAEYVVLRWEPLDGRHPFFEDPLSWRAMLDRYEIAVEGPHVLLLKRRENRRFRGYVALGTSHATWGQKVIPPDDTSMLLLEAHTTRSVLGSVRNLLYRNLPVYVWVSHRSGAELTWRVVRANLGSGAIVQPMPSGPEQLARFIRAPHVVDDPVISLRFSAALPSEFQPDIFIRWSRIVMEQDSSASEQTRMNRLRGSASQHSATPRRE